VNLGALASGATKKDLENISAAYNSTFDDPLLKAVTDLGYDREVALAALETHDYNIERVSLFCYPIVEISSLT
jgi:hypothetical protein